MILTQLLVWELIVLMNRVPAIRPPVLHGTGCWKSGVIEVFDDKTFMERTYSHHIILVEGDVSHELNALGKIMGFQIDSF